jgi:hypothetical protein
MGTSWLGTLAVAASMSVGIQSDAPELHGRVLDAGGQAAAGARISGAWSFPDPAGELAGEKESRPEPFDLDNRRGPVTANDRGEFVLPMAGDAPIYVLGADGRSGALVELGARGSAPLEIALAPLVEVRGRFEVKAPRVSPKTTALWVSAGEGKPVFVAVCFSESRELRVALPPGTYTLWHSTDAVSLLRMLPLREEPLVVQAGQGSVDLGSFELELPLVLHPQGVVLDSLGDPVPASLAESWWVHDGAMIPQDGFSTDDGRFRGSIEVHGQPEEITLLALDQSREQAALVSWNPARAAEPLEVRLQPAVRVTGSYRTDAGDIPPWTNTYVEVVLPDGARPPRVAECQSKEGRFEFRLPPGKYLLEGYGTDTTHVDLEIELGPDAAERDLGVIELPLSIIARNVGKQAMPWRLTDARGLPVEATLSDFRGKWVLLEFWGHW